MALCQTCRDKILAKKFNQLKFSRGRVVKRKKKVAAISKCRKELKILKTAIRIQKSEIENMETQLSYMRELGLNLDFNQQLFTDVTILASNGDRFPVHRSVLASRSEVFRAMLKSDMKEAKTREILIEDTASESLRLFLSFLYTAELLPDDIFSNFEGLVKLSHKYQVEYLLAVCDKFIAEKILNSKNIKDILKLSCLYGLPATKNAAFELVCSCPEIDRTKGILHTLKTSSADWKEIDVKIIHQKTSKAF